ncbi:MAG: DUF45 domain-containing protein [Clostridia bacterium]|nr:DUF45 domain-containing protein [Clostridia bacterium]
MKIIISRRNVKRIDIVMLPNSVVMVTAPMDTDMDYIKYFVSNKLRKSDYSITCYNKSEVEKCGDYIECCTQRSNDNCSDTVVSRQVASSCSSSKNTQDALNKHSPSAVHDSSGCRTTGNPNIIQRATATQQDHLTINREECLTSQYCYKSVLLYGTLYNVQQSMSNEVERRPDARVLYIPKSQYDSIEGRRKAIYSLIRKECKDKIAKIISVVGTRLSLCPSTVNYRQLRECWGKEQGTHIVIDYQTIQLPAVVQLYIVAHQLICLAHRPNSEVYNNKMYVILQQDCVAIQSQLYKYNYLKELFT